MNHILYDKVKKLKEYAKENEIPIIQDKGIEFLVDYLKEHKALSVLEIGTAIGYSAIMMALAIPELKITTIERDMNRYLEAVKNIKQFDLEKRITLIFSDALDVSLDDTFDLIFIDAAKAQNIKFFEHFEHNLKSGGAIITDNMEFHGLVEADESSIASKNLRGLVRKIKDYITYLEENERYRTQFVSVGDGLAISEKKD